MKATLFRQNEGGTSGGGNFGGNGAQESPLAGGGLQYQGQDTTILSCAEKEELEY